MAQGLLKPTSHKNVRVVPVDPHVKSAKPRKLFNAGVSEFAGLAKSADPSCYDIVTVEIRTGLFDIVEVNMHSFKAGDEVTVFQMHPSKGLMIEGAATVHRLIEDVDEQYQVLFVNDPGEVYERFLDKDGQENPPKYVREFNAKLGYKAA